ncbi:MAG TPA: ATP-binding cassette domain-containing protein [Gemmatimonadales bacterium]|nr:ATP-binding cassette domain-containing protein [Gemmatimonadales bacterium]
MTAAAPAQAPLAFIEVPLGRVRRTTLGGLPAPGAEIEGPFSLDVAAHTTVSVVGDEASGVDTLGGLALGLERAPAGQVMTLGTEIAKLARMAQLAFRRKVGYLPAGDGLMQNLTLRENIRLPLRFGSNFRPKDIEGRVDVIVAQLRLTHVADLRPAQTNAEERRRAALGRALAFDPELVVLEEPFDGLTDRAAGELLEAARGGETAAGSRRTVLITGASLPALLRHRVDHAHRLVRGRLDKGH